MQTLSKKRKVEHTFTLKDDDEEDWGNEITAEEFDIIQSQIVDAAAAPMVTTSVAVMQSAFNKDSDEQQLIEKGEIHMLRQKLEQKSKELEMERQEKLKQIQLNLKTHQEEQAKLFSKIQNLEGSLKFKDHELKTEQLKNKKLEPKACQPLQTMRNSMATMPSQFSKNFTHTSNMLHSSMQTEPELKTEDRKTALLKENRVYSNCKFNLSLSSKSSFCDRTNGNLYSKISSSRHQVFMKPVVSNELISVNQNYMESILMLHLHSICCCSDTSQLRYLYPTKEFIMFQTDVHHLKEYSKRFYANVQQGDCDSSNKAHKQVTSDVSSKYDLVTQSQKISSILSSICMICQSSQALCSIIIKSLKECTDINDFGEGLSVITICARPVFCNREIINKNMVNWAFRVLYTISSHCSYCCSKLFFHVVNNIGVFDTLNGSCTVETALFALKFLEQCSGSGDLFTHQNELCIFDSMVKLLKLCLPVKNSIVQNIEIVVVCTNLLTTIIVLHGVTIVYNNKCTCIADILEQVFKWISNQNVYKENLLIPIFHLLQTLYKQLETEKWFELRSRMNYHYILTLDKVCHSKGFHIPALRDLVMELWEQEILSCPQMIH